MTNKTKNTKGGLRKKKKLKSSRSRFLEALWEYHGGPFEAARRLERSPQDLINWRIRGSVPLDSLEVIRAKFKAPYQALNEKFGKPLGIEWQEFINNLPFASSVKQYILKGEHPKRF